MFESIAAAVATNPYVALLSVLVLVLAFLMLWLSLRLEKLLKGSDGVSLEGALRTLIAKVERLEAHARKTDSWLADLNRRVTRSVQGVSVKRFDPFGTSGGQQSFSTALLDEEGNGVVISGIHARGAVRVYAKEVKEFASERELSEDEESAITQAKNSLR